MRSRRRWITFDCFGTLVDWNSGFRRILEKVAHDQVHTLVRAYHRIEPGMAQRAPHLSYREVLAATLAEAASSCGIQIRGEDTDIIAESWGDVRPFEDIEESLTKLRESGYHLGVLTNCDNNLFEITHGQFLKPFDLVVTAESVMDYKPSLSHFRRFRRLTGAQDGEWTHVACSWFHDIVPSAKLGLPSVWFDRDDTGEDPSLASRRITRASELLGAVQAIEQMG